MAQRVKHLPTMQETRVRFLGREDPLEKEMATHSSTLAWKIPWSEKPGRLQSMGSQRVGHDWATSLHFTSLIDNISNEKLTLIPTVPSPHLHSLLKPVALNLSASELPGGLLGPTLRVSDSGGLGQGLQICISNKFPGGTDVADPGITLWELLF